MCLLPCKGMLGECLGFGPKLSLVSPSLFPLRVICIWLGSLILCNQCRELECKTCEMAALLGEGLHNALLCLSVVVPSLPKQGFPALQLPANPMSWTLSVDDGMRTHQLSLGQALQQGYNLLADDSNLIFQVAFTATGVVSYKVGEQRGGTEERALL